MAKDIFPDERLARYEWRKHGVCSGDAPQDYFRNVKKARAKIAIPAEFANASNARRIQPDDIARAFIKENPGLNADETAVVCHSGVFQEIRFCLTKDLENFRACPEVASHSCRAHAIQVPTP